VLDDPPRGDREKTGQAEAGHDDHHACASENLDAFIVFHSSQPGKSEPKTPTKNDPVSGNRISQTTN
jgi:hypothetical protein